MDKDVRSTLTFVVDAQDVATLERCASELLDGRVVAFDQGGFAALRRRDADVVAPLDLIEPAERAEADHFDRTLQSWWETHGALPWQGHDLLALARYRHVLWIHRVAWMAFAVDRILERLDPARVAVFDDTDGHGLDQPPDRRTLPLLAPLVRARASAHGRIEHVIARGAPRFDDVAAEQARPPAPAGATIRPPVAPYILFHANGSDVRRQLPIRAALDATWPGEVVHAYHAASPATLEDARAAGAPLTHVADLVPDVEPVGVAPAARAARERFDEAVRAAREPVRSVFTPIGPLRTHLDFLFGPYANALARHAASWDAFLRDHPPACLVSAFPTPIADLAARAGVNVVHVPHALLVRGRDAMFTKLAGGLVAANGPRHARELIAAGLPETRVRATGDPAADRFEPLRSAPTGPVSATVLLLSSASSMGRPDVDWRRHERTAADLGRLATRRSEWRFAYRGHPGRDHGEIGRALPTTARDRSREPLEVVAADTTVAVAVNAMTSAIVELSLLGVPVIVLDTALTWTDHGRRGTDAWTIVHSIDELEPHLEACLDGSAPAGIASRAVETHFGSATGGAAERCAALVSAIAGRRESERPAARMPKAPV